jgi:superfamily II DNA or RNA helicase
MLPNHGPKPGDWQQVLPKTGPAEAQKTHGLAPGTLVVARGDRWRVVESVDFVTCTSCRLRGAEARNLGVSRTLLLPFDRLFPLDRPERWRHVGRRQWVHALRTLLASDVTLAGLRGAAAARLDVMPYQLEPALASARGASRLLLADEVGLGKTVEAALILADLRARSDSVRALVLCPASLCRQWHNELSSRFGIPAVVADLPVLRRWLAQGPSDDSPWDRPVVPVVSLDFVKQVEVLQGMAGVRWDLLIVDEAHLAATAPERSAAVRWLAGRSRRVALLTATPHPGDLAAFEALCRVGQLPGDGPIAMFRRTRAGLGLPASRRVSVLDVSLSADELRLHAMLRRYMSRVWRNAAHREGCADARLAMIVLAKRAASGPASLLASLDRRLRALGDARPAGAWQLALPLGEPDSEADDEEPAGVLAAPGLDDRAAERQALERLAVQASAAVQADSKLRMLIRFLRLAGEPAVVFTEYRDTLSRVADALSPFVDLAIVHGGLDAGTRDRAVSAFNEGHAAVLLATDAAAHGLNLQARCRLVVSLDLPWNPVRLEQRVGRVDRIGQRRRVHAVHLVASRGTEREVMERLRVRDALTRRTFGGMGLPSEVLIAEQVIARTPALARLRPQAHRAEAAGPAAVGDPVACNPDLSPDAEVEGRRLRAVRQIVHPGPRVLERTAAALDRASPWWAAFTLRGAFRHAAVALFRTPVADRAGRVVEEIVTCVEVPATEKTAPAALPDGVVEAARDAAGRNAQSRLAGLRVELAGRLALEEARERRLAAAEAAAPPAPVQAGLFDRRALVGREATETVRRRLDDEASERLGAIEERGSLSLAGPPRLVLFARVRTRER